MNFLAKESFHISVAVDYILSFTVVQEWPLAEPSWLETTQNYFLLAKRMFEKVEVPWLMQLFGNISRHGDTTRYNSIAAAEHTR